MSRTELQSTYKNNVEAEPSGYSRRLVATLGTLALTPTLLLGGHTEAAPSQPSISPVLAGNTYKIGGTGDPLAQHLPRVAKLPRPALPIVYPAEVINLPGSADIGTEQVIQKATSDDDEVTGWSQGSLSAHNAAASGRMRAAPNMTLTSNPAHARVTGHSGQGIAHYATQFGFPQLQARSTRGYRGHITEKCIQRDPICDFDPSIPLGVAAMDYWNIHLGNGPINYNTINPNRAVVTENGNTTYIYYLQTPGKHKPVARQAGTPKLAKTPAMEQVTLPEVQPVQTPSYTEPYVAPEPAPYVAPVVAQAQETTNVVAEQATHALPQLAPQIRSVQKEVTNQLNNLARLVR